MDRRVRRTALVLPESEREKCFLGHATTEADAKQFIQAEATAQLS